MPIISSEEAYDQDDVGKVLELASEPSYISEIARKLRKYDPDWDAGHLTSLRKISVILSVIEDRDEIKFYDVGYGENNGGQYEASNIPSITEQEEGKGSRWKEYTIVHYETQAELRDEFRDAVDQSKTVQDKVEIIDRLSGDGNQVSKDAENIMQDALQRQFKHYDTIEMPEYNNPGVDFYVQDEFERDWGLAVEVSVRWVNPIDNPYLDGKKQKAEKKDADLLVLAPRFTKDLMSWYEDATSDMWNSDPDDQMVHLHNVPADKPTVYRPFVTDPKDIQKGTGEGNPVIIPDDKEARRILRDKGHVGDDYPIVDESREAFTTALQGVEREFEVVTESEFRHQIRQAIEPLLWEFLRPYKIEQFLIDTYWDKQLTQSDIGKLVDRSGSTIGSWMRKWGIIRRGTGAPELSPETIEVWKKMYRGEDPFPEQFSGYRIMAEHNRHPMWDIEDWEEWYQDTTEEERKQVMAKQDSWRDNLGYTLMYGPETRLQPSYSFILQTLKDEGVEVRAPDEAPRVPYSAYPSQSALEYMINKDHKTVVDVSEE